MWIDSRKVVAGSYLMPIRGKVTSERSRAASVLHNCKLATRETTDEDNANLFRLLCLRRSDILEHWNKNLYTVILLPEYAI